MRRRTAPSRTSALSERIHGGVVLCVAFVVNDMAESSREEEQTNAIIQIRRGFNGPVAAWIECGRKQAPGGIAYLSYLPYRAAHPSPAFHISHSSDSSLTVQ